MKSRILILLLTSGWLVIACNGDHSTRSGIDTVKNSYGVSDKDTAKTSKSNIDTGKITTTTGDASTIDNSGSGGTKIAKDTSKQKGNQKTSKK
jgi:hypothetical protein